MYQRRGLLGDNPPQQMQMPNYGMDMQQWGGDQFNMQNNMMMPMGSMMPQMMNPTGMPGPVMMTPMVDQNNIQVSNMMPPVTNVTNETSDVGEVVMCDENDQPLEANSEKDKMGITGEVKGSDSHPTNDGKKSGRDRENSNRRDSHKKSNDRDHPRESRGRRRSRSRSRDRNDRFRGDRRDRRSKWDNNNSHMNSRSNDVTTAGQMMQFSNPMYNNTMMGQAQLEMLNANMGVPAMPQQMMPGMHGMIDPSMMGMMTQMYPGMNPQMNQQLMGNNGTMMPVMTNQTIYINNAILTPPLPGTVMPPRRERPPGCRTVFVGGLPENVTADAMTEIFERFGTISDVKVNRRGFCHIRFEQEMSVDASFTISGYRFKYKNQNDNEMTNILIDYALNRDDQNEFEKRCKNREPTPPRIELFSSAALTTIADKIKSEDKFSEAAPTLAGWLERGECNKRNANSFYSMIQATNNQIRRLMTEKMQLEEEFQTAKESFKDKFTPIVTQ